jgi:hypothetical protein
VAEEILLLILLSVPGVDSEHSYGQPYLHPAVQSMVEQAPMKFHMLMSDAAASLRLYDRQREISPADAVSYDASENCRKFVNNQAHAAFINIMRCRYRNARTKSPEPMRPQ